jgi:OmcA/MtrC family decaheme c-type cytochrome
MIHSIHAGAQRAEQNPNDPFNFIRGNPLGTGGAGPMKFQDVVFPMRMYDCMTCHVAGSYRAVDNNSFAWSAIDVGPSIGDVATFNPKATVRIGPNTAACGSCHNSTSAKSHFAVNTVAGIGEGCNVCHGAGAAFEAHK